MRIAHSAEVFILAMTSFNSPPCDQNQRRFWLSLFQSERSAPRNALSIWHKIAKVQLAIGRHDYSVVLEVVHV